MQKAFVVRLSPEEREQLLALVKGGKASALKLVRARTLLKADQDERGPAWTDAEGTCQVDPAAFGGQAGGDGGR